LVHLGRESSKQIELFLDDKDKSVMAGAVELFLGAGAPDPERASADSRAGLRAQTTFQLFLPWLHYDFRAPGDGGSFAQQFLDSARPCDADLRAYIGAAMTSPLTWYEVIEVERGRGVRLLDLLRGGEVFALERGASQTLRPRHVVLAKVVPFSGGATIDAMGLSPLPPRFRDRALEQSRKALGPSRKASPTAAQLQGQAVAFITAYLHAVAEATDPARLPRQANTDGDPVILCKRTYSIVAGSRDALAARLGGIAGVESGQSDPGKRERRRVFSWIRPGNAVNAHWESTILGRLILTDRSLTLETNSRKRDTRLKTMVEAAAKDLLGAGGASAIKEVDVNDPSFVARLMKGAGAQARSQCSPDFPPEVEEQLRAHVRSIKERHYQEWLDTALPALHGRTPREAVRTPRGRGQVDELLREVEFQESADPEPFDVARLRRELGLM
jgi:hypothetical protein